MISTNSTMRQIILLAICFLSCLSISCAEESDKKEEQSTPKYTFETPEQRTAMKVELKQIGSPVWKPTEFRRFHAEIGDSSNDFNKLMTVVQCYASANQPGKNFFSDLNAYIPEKEHPNAFFNFITESMKACSFTDQLVFQEADFKAPNAIIYVFQLVPVEGLAPVGKSPYGDQDLIIPNAKFPIIVNGHLMKDGVEIDSNFDFTLPPLNTLKFQNSTESIPGDGYPHIPLLFGDAYDFVKDKFESNTQISLLGEYVFTVDLIDAEQSGWTVNMTYTLE
jgi:hypothetical protein